MTLGPELEARILRLYHVERWRLNTIAHQLRVHHSAVQRVIVRAGLPYASTALRASAVDVYVPFILETLKQFPTLTATRLFVMVRERGYRGSASQFRHRVALLRPRPVAEAYLRLRTLPGEQGQVDWGLCRARHSAHYAEFPHMPSDRSARASPLDHCSRPSAETRHSFLHYRLFRNVSNASSGRKVAALEPGGAVLASTRRFSSRSAFR